MRRRAHGKARYFAWIAAVAAAVGIPEPSRAQGDAEAARRAKVAVKVGARSLSIGELEDKLAEIPAFQLATFGGTREAAVRAYVERVVVRDLLLASAAEARALDKKLPTSHLAERALSTATLRAAHRAIPARAQIPIEDVQKYWEDHRVRFDSPERINLWRILCKTREEAASVLEAARREPTTAKYNDLAREHSLDKATKFRGGNLGFLSPDGVSNEAGLKVEPALLRAAQAVKDGELVPHVVPEGEAFAVVWRRGTVPASRRSVEQAAEQIRTTLYRDRVDGTDKKLIDELRAKNVKTVDYGLLGLVELPPLDAGITIPRGAPARAPSSSR